MERYLREQNEDLIRANDEKTSRAKAKEYERLKSVKSALSKREVELEGEMQRLALRLNEAESENAAMKKHHEMVTPDEPMRLRSDGLMVCQCCAVPAPGPSVRRCFGVVRIPVGGFHPARKLSTHCVRV